MENHRPGMPERIETERLYLRPYRAGDGELLFDIGNRNREHLSEYESANTLLHLKDQQHAETIAKQFAREYESRECFVLGIFEKNSDNWAGQVYVGPTNWDLPEFTMGFIADVHYERKGYVSEAVKAVLHELFTTMQAHRVTADCNEKNTRSWKLMDRCGFRREGHLRDNRKNPDGTFHGDFLYAMLCHDFNASHPAER